MAVSTTPWSNFTAADYTLAQWHRACLIHLHTSRLPSSKDQCKLPVREPDGTLNRNGVFAAAAVLAGARGGVDAPMEQKRKAARTIVSLYRNVLKAEPPEAVVRLARER
jgi:hypothetical protein